MVWYDMLFYKCRYHVCIKFHFTPSKYFNCTVYNVYTLGYHLCGCFKFDFYFFIEQFTEYKAHL